MEQSEHGQFKTLLAGYYAFKGKDISEFVLDVWWNAMRPYTYDAVKQAFNQHVVDPDRGVFLPQPADIVRIIDGGTVDRALVAWSKVDEAVKMIGGYDSVVFDDPAIHVAIDGMGGWIQLCEKSPDKEWPFRAAEFQKRYRAIVAQHTLEFPRVLIGRVEADCSSKGWPVSPPRTVGNVEQCRVVYRQGTAGTPQHKQIGRLLDATAGHLLERK